MYEDTLRVFFHSFSFKIIIAISSICNAQQNIYGKELFIKCFGFRRVALNSDLLVCAPLLLPMCLVKERKEAWKLVLMHFLLPFVIILQLGEQFWFNLMLTQKEIRCYRARMMGEKSAQSMWSEKRQRSLKTRMNMLDMCKFFMHANFYLWLPFFSIIIFFPSLFPPTFLFSPLNCIM